MTTAVYFDLDGTLLDYERPFDEILDRTLPVDATPEIAETFTDRLLSGLANVEPDPYERAFAATCEEHGVDADPSDLAAAHVRNEVEATRLAPSVRRLVEAVATRHQTGVLTNGD